MGKLIPDRSINIDIKIIEVSVKIHWKNKANLIQKFPYKFSGRLRITN